VDACGVGYESEKSWVRVFMRMVDDSRVRGLCFQMRGFPKRRDERVCIGVKEMIFVGIQCLGE